MLPIHVIDNAASPRVTAVRQWGIWLEQIEGAGYTVLGISPDEPDKLARFRSAESLDLVLLSDPDHAVAAAYGAYGEKKLYGRTVEGIIRSTFVVGPDGRLTQAWRNVKATGHVARVLAELGVG